MENMENIEKNVETDFIEETNEVQDNSSVELVPFSRIIVGLTESAVSCFLPTEEKKMQFRTAFESQALAIPELLGFDEVLSRKLLSGQGMSDNEVIAWGFAWIGITAALSYFSVNPIQFGKKKKLKENNKANDKPNEEKKGVNEDEDNERRTSNT